MKNFLIGFTLALAVGIAAYFGFLKSPECPECPECPKIAMDTVTVNSEALLSLAEIAFNKKTYKPGELESLVKFDREFYMAFFKTDLGKNYFYSRHGSCCPCSAGDMSCCTCLGGSGFGAPISASLRLANISEGSKSIYTLASYSEAQQTKRQPLTLDRKTIDTTDVFFVPSNTPPGEYFVTFVGKINVVIDIDVRGDGSFEVGDIR